MNKELQEIILSKGKDILYYCYTNEIGFPRNCGIASMVLTHLLHSVKEISGEYTINYVRGHYVNPNSEGGLCERYQDMSEYISYYNAQCGSCTCEHVNVHSWVELINKENGDVVVVDLTNSQFSEDVGDLEEYVLTNKLDKDELYQYVSEFSHFLLKRETANVNLLHLNALHFEAEASCLWLCCSNGKTSCFSLP